MRAALPPAVLIALFLFISVDVSAQIKERVRFRRESSSTVVNGTVRGYAYRDYTVRASAGQTLSVKLQGRGVVPVLTVFLPNGQNLEGAAQTDRFEGGVPVTGDYTVRVGMMRAAARRKGSVSNYILSIAIR